MWRELPAAPERPHAAATRQTDRPPTSGGGGGAADVAADAALIRLRRLRGFQHACQRPGEVAQRVALPTSAALRAADAAEATWSRVGCSRRSWRQTASRRACCSVRRGLGGKPALLPGHDAVTAGGSGSTIA